MRPRAIPTILTESYMYSAQNVSEQGDMEKSSRVQVYFSTRWEILWIGIRWNTANPNIDNAEYYLEKETGVLTVDNGATTTLSNTLFHLMFIKNQLCLQTAGQRYVDKGDKWWLQVILHQGRHWGDPQVHNQRILCSWAPIRFISWKGTFKCRLSSNSWKWSKNSWNFSSNEWRDRSSIWTIIPGFGRSFLC